ncbi:unnamed protein product, partial [marine sediment metagenome]
PIIPLWAINGISGIGTGWSSFCPLYNPLDMCSWLIRWLNKMKTPFLIPWYRDFDGTVELKLKEKNPKLEVTEEPKVVKDLKEVSGDEEEENEDEDPLGPDEVFEDNLDKNTANLPRYSVVTSGKYKVLPNGDIEVTELPIGRAPVKYREWLDQLIEKKEIKDAINKSTDKKGVFIIKGFKQTPSYKNLRLQKSFGLSNLVMLDPSHKPRKFSTIDQMMEEWASWRLGYYQKRKDYLIEKIDNSISKLNEKIRFLQAVLKGWEIGPILGQTVVVTETIHGKVKSLKRDQVFLQMDAMKFKHDLYQKTKLSNFDEDDILHLNQEVLKLQKDKEVIYLTPIEKLWLNDLQEFVKEYCRQYKIKTDIFDLNIPVKTDPTNKISIEI